MDIVVWLTVAALAVAAYTAFPTTFAWMEARRQRRGTEKGPPAIPAPAPKANRQEWVIGIYDYPPLSSIDSLRPWAATGPLVLMAKHIAGCTGHSVRLKEFSYEDFYNPGGDIPDMVMGMFETSRRREFVTFSRPIYEIGLQGICRFDTNEDIEDGLRNGRLKVAVYSGEAGWEFIKDEIPEVIEEHRLATLLGGHQMHTMSFLTAGAYDAVIMDHLSCIRFLNQHDNHKKFKLAFPNPITTYDAGIALRNDHINIMNDINDIIIEYRNSEEYFHIELEALTGISDIVRRRSLRRA